MAVSTPVQALTDVELMAHLFRRAGFGATRDEIEAAVAKGYEATVDELIHPERQPEIELDLIYRFWPDAWEGRRIEVNQGYWLYRMVNTQRPLEEKIALFWHCLFATAFNKSNHSGILLKQIDMFRQYGLGDFAPLLVELSKDPAMIHWLDNQENTIKVHNENYGRELLELFSMGIGNYTEDDVKECARAFTGWGLKNLVRAGPMGRNDWEFQFYPEMHDYGEKTFLGETGNFDGPDVINIIVKQPATAQFIARRLYLFFVSDEPNQEAIDELARVFTETGGNIRAVVKALLLSDVFRSRAAYYAKVKSPAEHVAGLVRLVGDHRFPNFGIHEVSAEFGYMGQDLMNPPSVEGWHTGKEWIDTGILVERINFAAGLMADPNKPGVRALIDRVRAQGDELSPKQLVDTCLDLIGPLPVREATEASLVDHASKKGVLNVKSGDPEVVDQRITEMLQLIVATREYQFG